MTALVSVLQQSQMIGRGVVWRRQITHFTGLISSAVPVYFSQTMSLCSKWFIKDLPGTPFAKYSTGTFFMSVYVAVLNLPTSSVQNGKVSPTVLEILLTNLRSPYTDMSPKLD